MLLLVGSVWQSPGSSGHTQDEQNDNAQADHPTKTRASLRLDRAGSWLQRVARLKWQWRENVNSANRGAEQLGTSFPTLRMGSLGGHSGEQLPRQIIR